MLRHTIPLRLKLPQELINLLHLLVRQLHQRRVLPHALHVRRPGDGDDRRQAVLPALRGDPGEGNLCGGSALARGEGLDGVHELEVEVEDVGLKAGAEVPEVVLGEVGVGLELAGL